MAARTRRSIGILTGGGDVPGLNSVIKSVVYRATGLGRDVIGIRRGWEGLTRADLRTGDDPRYVRRLTRESTRTIDRSGGTVLHTSRTNPQNIRLAGLPTTLTERERARFAHGAQLAIAYWDPDQGPTGWDDYGHVQSSNQGWIDVTLGS